MPVKLVASFEIDDTQLKRAQEDFDKLQKKLSETSASWMSIDKSNKEVRKSAASMLTTMQQQTAALRVHTAMHKAIADSARATATQWNRAADSVRDVYKSVKKILKWSGIGTAIGGVLGAGSIWGFERLAASAAAGRRSSTGLGTTYGGQQAFGITFGRLLDTSSFMRGISEARGDPSSAAAGAMFALGVNPMQSRDTGAASVETLKKMRDFLMRYSPSIRGGIASAMGFGSLGVGTEDVRRITGSDQEFNEYLQQHQENLRDFEVRKEALKKMQDFDNQLERAGQRIKSVFIDGLEDIAPELKDLSKGLTDAVTAFVRSPAFKDMITSLTTGLHEFSTYVGTEDFKNDVRSFAQGLKELGDSAVAAARFLGLIHDPNAIPKTPGTSQVDKLVPGFGWWEWIVRHFGIHPPRTPSSSTSYIGPQPGASSGVGIPTNAGDIWMHNPGSIMHPLPGGGQELNQYASDAEGIRDMGRLLQKEYLSRGQTNLRDIIMGINGQHNYVGAANENERIRRENYLRRAAESSGLGERGDIKTQEDLIKAMISMIKEEGHYRPWMTPQNMRIILTSPEGNAIPHQTAAMGYPS